MSQLRPPPNLTAEQKACYNNSDAIKDHHRVAVSAKTVFNAVQGNDGAGGTLTPETAKKWLSRADESLGEVGPVSELEKIRALVKEAKENGTLPADKLNTLGQYAQKNETAVTTAINNCANPSARGK